MYQADNLVQDSETVLMGQELLYSSLLQRMVIEPQTQHLSLLKVTPSDRRCFCSDGKVWGRRRPSEEPESVGEAEQVVKRKQQCEPRLKQGGRCSLIPQESSGSELICFGELRNSWVLGLRAHKLKSGHYRKG